jgi:hypothetical protein
MRVAILSDMHLGDPMCSLVTYPKDEDPVFGPAYPKLKAAVGDALDYLVLVGV